MGRCEGRIRFVLRQRDFELFLALDECNCAVGSPYLSIFCKLAIDGVFSMLTTIVSLFIPQ